MDTIPSLHLSQIEFEKQYNNTPEELREIWNVELELLDEIDRICKKYDITYYVDGGTLIGAIRHGGFIPWDDDIDIQMFYDEYLKLSNVIQNEIREPYFWQTWETEDGFMPWIAKLRSSKLNIKTDYELTFGNKWNTGVPLDIFVLYYIPDNLIIRNTQLFILKVLRSIFHGYESYKSNAVRANNKYINTLFCLLYKMVRPFCDYKKLSQIYNKVVLWQKIPSSRVGVLAFEPGKKNLEWEAKWFASTVNVPFMGRMVPAPIEWDLRLKRQYGDYMKPVKGSSRHGTMKIK